MYEYTTLFIHSSVDGYLCCCHLLLLWITLLWTYMSEFLMRNLLCFELVLFYEQDVVSPWLHSIYFFFLVFRSLIIICAWYTLFWVYPFWASFKFLSFFGALPTLGVCKPLSSLNILSVPLFLLLVTLVIRILSVLLWSHGSSRLCSLYFSLFSLSCSD